jgi:hypothetical protein
VERNDDPFATPQFPENWMYIGSAVSGPAMTGPVESGFVLKIHCKDLLLLYKDTGSLYFAPADIIIDGIKTRTIDPRVLGWNHCGATFILNTGHSACHTVEIRPGTADAQVRFTVLGFGYT